MIKAYQIVHDDITREQRDPGFEPLENSNSTEPDWYEYWPIRNYLHTMPLDESTLYGFVSPRFKEKTGLSADKVRRFIQSSEDADVYIFSPFPLHGTSFLNVVEHMDFFFRGFMEHGGNFFRQFDQTLDVRNMVNNSSNTVFSNFFFAKPVFWREWLRICDQLFEETKDARHPLNSKCSYAKDNGDLKILPVKVFVVECVASYVLATSKRFSSISYPFQSMPSSDAHSSLAHENARLDDLKRQWEKTRQPQILRQYRLEQNRVIGLAWPGQEPPDFDLPQAL
ncbi:hypothetical protein B0B52_10400 [Polaromonas sp. A23]|nr:hypothetical protein B0B52_10400 [Polaromonas sp. A23]